MHICTSKWYSANGLSSVWCCTITWSIADILLFGFLKWNLTDTWLNVSHSTSRKCNSWWRHEMERFSALLAIKRGIHWGPVNSSHKGQWRGVLMFSLICVWINGWVNTREAGDLRGYRAHYDVTVMWLCLSPESWRPICSGIVVLLSKWLVCWWKTRLVSIKRHNLASIGIPIINISTHHQGLTIKQPMG